MGIREGGGGGGGGGQKKRLQNRRLRQALNFLRKMTYIRNILTSHNMSLIKMHVILLKA